jgi:hypothetical protein
MQLQIDWTKILPVLVSIGVILAVAYLRQYSRTFAAIAATMPINIPLGLWIVYSGVEDAAERQKVFTEFAEATMINMFPTLAFIIAGYLVARAGHGLIPTILVGYVVWGLLLGVILLVRAVIR